MRQGARSCWSARRTPATRAEFPPEPDFIPGEARITLPLWRSLHRSLKLANVEDGIDTTTTTTRIRAAIELWDHDPRIRAKIDKLARHVPAPCTAVGPQGDLTMAGSRDSAEALAIAIEELADMYPADDAPAPITIRITDVGRLVRDVSIQPDHAE